MAPLPYKPPNEDLRKLQDFILGEAHKMVSPISPPSQDMYETWKKEVELKMRAIENNKPAGLLAGAAKTTMIPPTLISPPNDFDLELDKLLAPGKQWVTNAEREATVRHMVSSTGGDITDHDKARSMLMDRISGPKEVFILPPNDMLVCHVQEEVVHVFFVFGSKAGHIECEVGLFPSDGLVTQMRLILST